MAEKTTVSKNKTAAVGKYSYKYTDLAQIHEEMERQGLRYYQYVEPLIVPGVGVIDYIRTVIIDANTNEELRNVLGFRIVDANGQNPTQEHGKAITYDRRYSLLAALGWATDDDDASGNIRTRPERKTQNTARNTPQNAPHTAEDFVQCITAEQIDEVRKCLAKMGYAEKDVLKRYKINTITALTMEDYASFMAGYQKTMEGKE